MPAPSNINEIDVDYFLANNPDVANGLANWFVGVTNPNEGGLLKDSSQRREIIFNILQSEPHRPWRSNTTTTPPVSTTPPPTTTTPPVSTTPPPAEGLTAIPFVGPILQSLSTATGLNPLWIAIGAIGIGYVVLSGSSGGKR